jgi:hypothetical protein
MGHADIGMGLNYYYYYLDKLTNRMSQLQVKQVKNKAKKKKHNDETTKQSLRINRTIPTHTNQLASYCRSLMRGLK